MKKKERSKPSSFPDSGFLPGDPSSEEIIHRIIRVNQAGEYGAKRIYSGQLTVLGKKPISKEIKKHKNKRGE